MRNWWWNSKPHETSCTVHISEEQLGNVLLCGNPFKIFRMNNSFLKHQFFLVLSIPSRLFFRRLNSLSLTLSIDLPRSWRCRLIAGRIVFKVFLWYFSAFANVSSSAHFAVFLGFGFTKKSPQFFSKNLRYDRLKFQKIRKDLQVLICKLKKRSFNWITHWNLYILAISICLFWIFKILITF